MSSRLSSTGSSKWNVVYSVCLQMSLAACLKCLWHAYREAYNPKAWQCALLSASQIHFWSRVWTDLGDKGGHRGSVPELQWKKKSSQLIFVLDNHVISFFSEVSHMKMKCFSFTLGCNMSESTLPSHNLMSCSLRHFHWADAQPNPSTSTGGSSGCACAKRWVWGVLSVLLLTPFFPHFVAILFIQQVDRVSPFFAISWGPHLEDFKN